MSQRMERQGLWTVPNAISVLRLLGLPLLLWAAYQQRRWLFLGIMVALFATDWLDGKLAELLDQRTVLGARLDGAADALVYASLGLSFWWLDADVVRATFPWLLAGTGSWVVSAVVALSRFGRFPNYHTRAYKAVWSVVGATGISILFTQSGFLVPWAMIVVILANLEGVAVGLVLPEWEADVSGLRHALRARKAARQGET